MSETNESQDEPKIVAEGEQGAEGGVMAPEDAVKLLLQSEMFTKMGKAQQRLVKKLLGSKEGISRITSALEQSKGNKIDAARSMIGSQLEAFLPPEAFEGGIGDLLASLDEHDQLLDDEASEDDRNDVGTAQMQQLQEKAADMMALAGLTKGTPIVNSGVRVGRNDKCPCGSGRKYKQCCLRGKK